MIVPKKLARISERVAKEKTFSTDNIQVLIIASETYTVVAFRGTEFEVSIEGLKDICTNLTATTISTEDCGVVHKGIYKAAKAACQELETKVSKSQDLVFTGFSMGGALALLASKIMQKKGYKIEACVTFGSPRVVCQESKPLYKDFPIQQFVHSGDIVPEKFYRYRKYANVVTPIIVGSTRGSASWKDHDIDKYISNV